MEALRISDLTTTVGFLTTTYRVTSWSPAVARRRAGMLGGRGPYEDVDEELTITISGANVMDALGTIEQLFDQACRFGRGEPVNPVYFDYQPTSTAGYYRVVILGPPDSGQMIEMPDNSLMGPTITVLDNVVLRFKRQGLWLNVNTVTSTSGSTTNGDITTISGLTATPVPSPVRLTVNLPSTVSDYRGPFDSFVLMTSAATTAAASSRLLTAAASVGVEANFTTAADAAGLAPGGAVLRFTPPDTATNISGTIISTTAHDTNGARWGMWLSYRNNGETAFTIRGFTYQGVTPILTPPHFVEGGITNPKWVYLGSVTRRPHTSAYFGLYVTASDTSGTIDFGRLTVMTLDKPDTDRVIHIGESSVANTVTNVGIDHRMLTHLVPAVYYTTGSAQVGAYSYSGDAAFMAGNAALAVTWLATDDTDARWVATTDGTPAITTTFTVVQNPAGLTPE